MVFTTNKEKGNSSLGVAIAYYSSNGYAVSIPLNDTQDLEMYVIPIKEIKNKSTLNICNKYEKYKVR